MQVLEIKMLTHRSSLRTLRVSRIIHRGATGSAAKRATTRHVYGAGFLFFLVVLFSGFLWIAAANVKTVHGKSTLEAPHTTDQELTSRRNGLKRPSNRRVGSAAITGSMSLAELADATSVPVADLVQRLALPQDASWNEHLGRFGRRYGFDVPQVREIVEELESERP